MNFQLRLKELREEFNLSQKELAQKLNVSTGAIGMWETGERTPTIEGLKKIAEFFNVSLDYVVGKTDNKTQDIILKDVYFRLASEAQEAGIAPEDVEAIIELYKKLKK